MLFQIAKRVCQFSHFERTIKNSHVDKSNASVSFERSTSKKDSAANVNEGNQYQILNPSFNQRGNGYEFILMETYLVDSSN